MIDVGRMGTRPRDYYETPGVRQAVGNMAWLAAKICNAGQVNSGLQQIRQFPVLSQTHCHRAKRLADATSRTTFLRLATLKVSWCIKRRLKNHPFGCAKTRWRRYWRAAAPWVISLSRSSPVD